MILKMRRLLFVVTLLVFIGQLSLASEVNAPETLGWSEWDTLGGQITSDPAACTGGKITFVFARGTDNQIWYRKRFLDTGVWADWARLPVVVWGGQRVSFSGAPAVRCIPQVNGTVIVNVVAVGFDTKIYEIYGWGSPTSAMFSNVWNSLNNDTAYRYSGLAMATWGSSVHYFVRGTTNSMIYLRSREGSQWSGWTLLSDRTINDPSAVMISADRLDYFMRDRNGALWQQFRFGTQWQQRTKIADFVYSGPEVVSRDRSSMDLFVQGANNVMLHRRWVNGVWGTWQSLGGSVTSSPGATTYANNARIFVFARWTDGSLRYKAWAP